VLPALEEPAERSRVDVAIAGDFGRRTPGTRLHARRERTRAKILAVAGRLFRHPGFEATSIHVIAEEAGIGVGTLYGYFESKDEILREVLFADSPARIEAFRAAIAAELDGLERLLFSFDMLTQYIDENRPILRAILLRTAEGDDTRAQPLEWLFLAARALILAGQAQGQIRALPVDTTARLIAGAALSAGLGQGVWRGTERDPATRADLRSILRELLTPPA
jgi:AcrR family transcriptional regulator